MKKIDRIIDAWGQEVIRVYKCDNFEKVAEDIPIFISERLHNSENAKNPNICDIIKQVEIYLYGRGGIDTLENRGGNEVSKLVHSKKSNEE